jgi:hypothetical protein
LQALWTYVKWSPLCGAVFVVTFIIFLACQTSRQISDWWLRQWTSDARGWYPPSSDGGDPSWSNDENPPLSAPGGIYDGLSASQAYIITYFIPVGFFVISMFFRGYGFHWWTHGAGQKLHKTAVKNIMYAPLGFFLRVSCGEWAARG